MKSIGAGSATGTSPFSSMMGSSTGSAVVLLGQLWDALVPYLGPVPSTGLYFGL